jgi:hypothetical protein
LRYLGKARGDLCRSEFDKIDFDEMQMFNSRHEGLQSTAAAQACPRSKPLPEHIVAKFELGNRPGLEPSDGRG